MQLVVSVSEALSLALARGPLPTVLRSVVADGSTIHAEIDLRAVPDPPTALRLAASALGTVSVALRFLAFDGAVATFEVSAQARALPAHKLLNYLVGPINRALTTEGLPDGLVEIRKGTGEPVLAIGVRDAVAAQVDGITLTALAVRDGAVHASATVGDVRLR
ncbi:hypothetical protein [Sanguibacter antarcticus]|uniref:Uncharacterized protein n=1 Tax=Sanguibacter antarcticus TaxID=372484 RepID=A0A2A9E4E3_9MICO|nr:hypothetical protein [Sanguibacter antarcticus]PFG33713.1 hypothetical protein ATL42_1600 [Sanguibacter antarcticus]